MSGRRVILASNNPGKVAELQQLLADLDLEVLAQSALAVPEAEETGRSFVENALLKARNACAHTGLPAIADDSGLEVDALRGAPGIHSARYAGPAATDADNVEKLLGALADTPKAERTARFQCVAVYLRHADDPTPIIAQGTWEGRILEAPRGSGGFGYDPVFLVSEANRSAAELAPTQKNAVSHRGQALRQLAEALRRREGVPDGN